MATRCSCGGKYSTDLVAYLLPSPRVKEFKKSWSAFVKVINEYRVAHFLWFTVSYSARLNNMKLVRWPLYLVQREGNWVGPQPAQVPPSCTNVTAHL